VKNILITICSLSLTIAHANLPVMLDSKGDPLDPCSYAQIIGLNPNGDGFLTVRSEPNKHAKPLDRLYNGNKVWYCDQKGQWVGIVYGKNCHISSPANPPRAYKGSCKSGWVFGKWVSIIAG